MNLFTGIMIPFIGTTLVFAVTLHNIPEGGSISMPFVGTGMSKMRAFVEELIPETAEGEHSNIVTIGFAIGFTLMMALDVALG